MIPYILGGIMVLSAVRLERFCVYQPSCSDRNESESIHIYIVPSYAYVKFILNGNIMKKVKVIGIQALVLAWVINLPQIIQ